MPAGRGGDGPSPYRCHSPARAPVVNRFLGIPLPDRTPLLALSVVACCGANQAHPLVVVVVSRVIKETCRRKETESQLASATCNVIYQPNHTLPVITADKEDLWI